jgi:hypothetical protein
MPRACPSVDDYQQLSLGLLPDSVAAELEEHLLGCLSCVATVRSMSTDPRLVAALHAQAEPTPVAERKQIDTLIGRMLAQDFSSHEATFRENGPAVLTPPDVTQELYGSLAPAQQADEIGRLGPYRVLKVLGIGGMGVVFLAEDPQLRRLVALKTMKSSLAANLQARQRFLREAQAAAALSHDHIVTIHQVGQDRDVPYLAMQLLQGETLEDRLNRLGKLPIAEVLRVGREIAEGLGAAHERGLVHRDIKPGNIWLEAERDRVKILDFGLAKSGDALELARAKASSPGADIPLVSLSPVLTHTGTLLGTPAYMSPEQALGGTVDHRSDLFSLGCVLFRMSTGEAPFKGKDTNDTLRALTKGAPRSPCELNGAVPPELSALILKLLAKKPAERLPTAAAVAHALGGIRTRRRFVRWRRVAAVAAVLLLAVGGFWFGPALFGPRDPSGPRWQGFHPAVTYPVGKGPRATAVADFNGDGVLDLVVANQDSNTISVLLGAGDGTFQKPVDFEAGKGPFYVAAGDLNGDGKLDLVVANSADNTVSVLLGNGDGTFQKSRAWPAGHSPHAVILADFNGDGKLDIAVVNAGKVADEKNGSVSVLLGKGDGTFDDALHFETGLYSCHLAVADINGNGKLDLAVANHYSNTISVLLGNGDGTFRAAVNFPAGDGPHQVAVADVSGDGKLDLAVANHSSNTISVLLGNGDGTFQPAMSYPTGKQPAAVAAADFNGDGIIDLVVANRGSRTVSVLLGQGGGTFQPAVAFPMSFQPNGLAVADLNRDGAPDVVVTNHSDGNLSVFLNKSGPVQEGEFADAGQFPAGFEPGFITVGDVNRDGRLDLVVTNLRGNSVSVLLGNADGSFAPACHYATGKAPAAAVLGDLNGDGKLDLVVANSADTKEHFRGSVCVLMGNGDGTFQEAIHYQAGPHPSFVALADLDRDGKLDLIVVNGFHQPGSLSVFRGKGDGTFHDPVHYPLGVHPGSLVVADFDGDGKLDLVVVNGTSATLSYLRGKGDGTFQKATSIPTRRIPHTVVAGDFNGDGKMDLAVSIHTDGNFVTVFLGKGDGTFHAAVDYPTGTGPRALAVADFNNDGKLDLVAANYNGNNVSMLLGNGDGTFRSAVHYLILDSTDTFPSGLGVGDFNRDGRLDLAVSLRNLHRVAVLRNQVTLPGKK